MKLSAFIGGHISFRITLLVLSSASCLPTSYYHRNMRLLLAFLAAMPLAAQCTYTVTPPQAASVSYASATGSISVTASSFCTWTYASDSSWLTFNGQQTGQFTGTYTITYAVTANLQPATRTAKVTIADSVAGTEATIAVTQQASPCSLTLPSTASEIGVSGAGASSFAVQSNCVWNSWSNARWITVTSGASGGANGSVGYSVTANACLASRSGSLTVEAGSSTEVPLGAAYPYPVLQFTVNQNGSNNNLSFTPANASFAAAGGTGILAVTTGAGCSWSSVYSDVNWIGISNTSGFGPGNLNYTVAANTGAARAGNIHIGALTFPVTQQAAAAPTPQIIAIDNSASFAPVSGASGVVAPGEIVSIFGTNLGPSTGVGLQLTSSGSVATALGGTQVLFDGRPAALTYVSAVQVNAVVPFEVSGNPTTTMTVNYQEGTSAPSILNVQAASPGIYTLDGSGSGAGAVLNQDYSINSVARPAARGWRCSSISPAAA